VKEGDLIKVGQLILMLSEGTMPKVAPTMTREEVEEAVPTLSEVVQPNVAVVAAPVATVELPPQPIDGIAPPASPSIRKLARELGIDLRRVRGSERGGRIVMEDVRKYIQHLQEYSSQPQASQPTQTTSVTSRVDFAKYGPVTRKKITTLRRTISTRMTESWNAIPHVTQFDECDITDIVSLRKKFASRYEKKSAHLTLTPILLKALVRSLQKHPLLNASLEEHSGELVLKEYFNIGIAVDTEQGLLVPVIKDVDRKSVFDLSVELQTLAERARKRTLPLEAMQGGTFTVSNQGGIGSGTFTPIINKPEVAILGVARSSEAMLFRKKKLMRRTVLPLSLSYDHRLIDGADAARFMVDLVKNIEGMTEKEIKI
jgi:pyruvate dehydrogenase E2 component (dihydrolipoamide acetyltransferase)